MKPRALSTLKREAAEAARFRGHVLRWGADFQGRGAGRASTGSCRCGAWASVEQTPAPNGIEVSGPAVAVSCPAHAMLRDRRGRPTAQGFACGYAETREDAFGRVSLWREHGVYHVAAVPSDEGTPRSHACETLAEARKVAARFRRELRRAPTVEAAPLGYMQGRGAS